MSQSQTLITLIKKSNKNKKYVANCRIISLLTFDLKILSHSKEKSPRNAKETTYVNEKFIGESGRLIDNVFKIMQQINC